MRKQKDFFKVDFNEFYELFTAMPKLMQMRFRGVATDIALLDWPEDEGFGSSDASCRTYEEFGRPSYDEKEGVFFFPDKQEEVAGFMVDRFNELLDEYGDDIERMNQRRA